MMPQSQRDGVKDPEMTDVPDDGFHEPGRTGRAWPGIESHGPDSEYELLSLAG